MTLVRLHKRLTYLMIAVPFAALVQGGEMNPTTTAVFVAGLVASWFWEEPRVDHERWSRAVTIATVAVTLLTALRIVQLGELAIGPFVDLVLLLTVLKLLQRRGPRDYVQLAALSLLMMAAASAYNQGLMFALSFAAYMVVGTITLAVKHLREELTRHHPGELARYRAEGGVLATVAGLAVVVFAFSVLFFLAFPRMGFGLFNQAGRNSLMSAGFSDEVSLGQHGRVRTDPTVVMRVRLVSGRRPNAGELRWRGTSFDTYDGRRWLRQSVTRESAYTNLEGLYLHPGAPLSRVVDDATVQDIYLEPLNSDVLFGLPQLWAIEFPDEDPDLTRSFFREYVRVSRLGEFFLERSGATGVHYRAHSLPQPAPDSRATWIGGAADFRDRRHRHEAPTLSAIEADYLQLPDVLTDRFRALATSAAGDGQTAFERARNIARYLLDNYSYTTNLPRVDSDNPIESFLFETRRGHCEYFATAMVLLAREVGVPARNVNGFLGGDWNDLGDFYAVRQSHAHSWVEVLLPDVGWYTFDPTPASGLPTVGESGFWASIRAFFDNLRMLWYRYVVDFDLERQLGAVRTVAGLFGGGENLALDLRRLAFAVFRNFGVIASVVLIWLAQLWLLVRRHRRDRLWERTDSLIGAGALLLSEVLVLGLWRPQATLRTLILAGSLPAVTWVLAWLARRGGEVRRADRRRRRGRLAPVSRAFLKLVHTLSKVGFDYVASDTPDALIRQARERGVGYVGELRAAVGDYQRLRFGGRCSDAEVASLRRRLRALRHAIRRR